jgi:hypothetical protein
LEEFGGFLRVEWLCAAPTALPKNLILLLDFPGPAGPGLTFGERPSGPWTEKAQATAPIRPIPFGGGEKPRVGYSYNSYIFFLTIVALSVIMPSSFIAIPRNSPSA